MTDKPILFSGPMIRALLDGRKTQTRRVLKPQPPNWVDQDKQPGRSCMTPPDHIEFRGRYVDQDGVDRGPGAKFVKLPYAPGDRLWVREAHVICDECGYPDPCADANRAGIGDRHCCRSCDALLRKPLASSAFMLRWASRLTLVVTDVRVQRVQEISEEDAIAEGVFESDVNMYPELGTAQHHFQDLWDSLNAKRGFGWSENPWVVATTFTVHKCNIDQMEDTQ